jgi:GDP-L-fucose synthase
MNKQARIFVAGHRGMVGSALVRRLNAEGYHNVVTRSRAELDLKDQAAVNAFFQQEKIDVVLLAAARVGGILANASQPGEFIYDNLVIETNVIHAAYRAKVERLVFFGSSCIYPKQSPQPIREEYLLSSPLEPTNDAYAIAKIAGLKLCEAYNREYGTQYVSLMQPCFAGAAEEGARSKSERLRDPDGLGLGHAAPRVSPRRRSRRGNALRSRAQRDRRPVQRRGR